MCFLYEKQDMGRREVDKVTDIPTKLMLAYRMRLQYTPRLLIPQTIGGIKQSREELWAMRMNLYLFDESHGDKGTVWINS